MRYVSLVLILFTFNLSNVFAQPAIPAKLLLTELVVTPTAGEYVEIHNPGSVAIDLTDYYISDATFAPSNSYYYNIVTGANAGGGGFGDFHARFPSGAMIGPGEYQTISMAGSQDFNVEYGVDPTYELFEDGAMPDAIPDMLEALPGSINDQGGLTNSGEFMVLYYWDGSSDLVVDIDYTVWGDKDEAVDKSGVSIDGPDGDLMASSFLSETSILAQDVLHTTSHSVGNSFQRIDLMEGTQTNTGSNGVDGRDETSENLSVTWIFDETATPNAPSANTIIPPPAAVPTLGQWGLIVCGFLFMIFGVVAYRNVDKKVVAGI